MKGVEVGGGAAVGVTGSRSGSGGASLVFLAPSYRVGRHASRDAAVPAGGSVGVCGVAAGEVERTQLLPR